MFSKPRTPPPPLIVTSSPLSVLCLYVLAALVLFVPFTRACSDANDVNCQICPHSSRGNDISGFPRLTAGGHSTSSDLGHFTWLSCNSTGGDCHSYLGPLEPSYSAASDHSSPDNYVQSLLAYTTFALCCAVVAVAACLVFLVLRYCTYTESGGGAGGRYPTAASTHPLSLGYGHNDATGELQYSPAQRWSARAWMWLSVALLLVWVAVGWFEGGRHVQSNAKAVVAAPWPLVQQVQSTQPAVVTLLTDMGQDVLAATITNISTALSAAVDLPALVDQLSVAEVALMSLPSVQPVQTAFDQLQANTTAISTAIETSLPLFTASFTDITALSELTANLSASLASYQSLASPLTSSLLSAENYLTALSSYIQILYDPSSESGFIEFVILSLQAYSTVLPPPSQLAQVAASVELVLGLGAGEALNATEAASLFGNVLQLESTLFTIPSYESTANEMSSINQFMSSSSGYISTAASYLNQSDHRITQLLPLLALIELQYAKLLQTLNVTLPVDAAVEQLLSMQASLAQLPSIDGLEAALTVMPTLQSVVAEIDSVLQPLAVLTNEFLSLPSSALLLSYESQLNSSVAQAQQQFAETIANLQTALSMAATLNVSSDVASIQQLSDVSVYQPHTNNSSFIHSLPTVNATLAPLHLGSYVQPLVDLHSAYATTIATVNTSVSDSYFDLGAVLGNILANISTTLTQDLTTFIGGYCQHNAAVTCNSQHPCSQGDACVDQAVKRCAKNPTVYCNYSTQCPAGDRCLIDAARYEQLLTSLQLVYAVAPSQNTTNALIAQYETVTAAVTNAAISSYTNKLTPAAHVVNATTVLVPSLADNVAGVQTTLAGYNDSTVVVVEYEGVLAALAAANTSAASDAVNSINATLVAIAASNVTAQLTNISTTLTTLSSFLYSAYPSTFAPRLTTAALDASYTGDEAVSNLTSFLASTLTDITQYLAAAPALSVLDVDAVADTDGVRDWLHLLYSPLVSQYGAFYYFASLYTFAFATPALLTPTTTPSYTVTLTPSHEPYSNNTYCLTNDCLTNSVDYYWTHDVSETTKWNVQLSPSDITGPLLLLPFFLALMGLACTMLCWSYKWSTAAASATAIIVFLLLPLIFLVAAFTFPLALMQGDVCRGGANALYDAMLARQDMLCTEWFGGVGTAEQCTLSTASLNATVNLQAVVYDVASGQCSADYNNALDEAFASLRLSVATWPLNRVASLTAALASSSSIVIQPELQAIIDSSAAVATERLDVFLAAVQSTLTCSSLHSQLVAVQSSFCCSLTSSLYWAASAWFLIAFTLCCCEGPAAVYGSKRFSERLVGGALAPGVLYDPHGEYQHDVLGGGPNSPTLHDRTKLALMTADSEGGEIELVKSPKATDSLLNGINGMNGMHAMNGKSGTVDTTPRSGNKKTMEQCVVCLRPTLLLATMAACGHKVCRECAQSHVRAELSKRTYPILCPLSQLKRQSAPACQQSMADDDVVDGLTDKQRNDYTTLKALAGSIPATTAPSSPVANAAPEEKAQVPSVPPVIPSRDLIRDRYRPLPPRRSGGGGHTPNAHAFISTPGGSFSILQHPMSHYALTGQGGTEPMAMTRTGGGLYGTGTGTGTLGGTMFSGPGHTREIGFDPRRFNRTFASSSGDRPRAGVAHNCPQPDCSGLVDQRTDTQALAVCPLCSYRWCLQCDVPWHDGQTCEQAQLARRRAMDREVEMEMARQQMAMQQRRGPVHWAAGTGTAGTSVPFDGAQSGMEDVAEGNEEAAEQQR